jgi:hypothetical protein
LLRRLAICGMESNWIIIKSSEKSKLSFKKFGRILTNLGATRIRLGSAGHGTVTAVLHLHQPERFI